MFKHTGEKKFLGRAVLAAGALVGLLAFAATPRAYADDDHCQRRIAKDWRCAAMPVQRVPP